MSKRRCYMYIRVEADLDDSVGQLYDSPLDWVNFLHLQVNLNSDFIKHNGTALMTNLGFIKQTERVVDNTQTQVAAKKDFIESYWDSYKGG